MGGAMEVMKPYVVITLIYLNFSLITIFIKSVVSDGVSGTILNLYQFIVATVVLFSLSFFLERKQRPSISFIVLCWAFLLGLLQMTLNQVLSAWSLRLISATFYSVVTNMSPAIVFFLAVVSRRESLHLCSATGQAKVWGVAASVAGATVMVAWSGPVVLSSPSTASGSQALGFAMSVCAIFSSSLWTLLVERVAKKFPADLTLAALMSFFGTIQTATFAAITEPLYSWKIRWTGSLMPFVILYGGCIMPLLAFYALIWCIHKKGPVFAAAFSPLQIVFSFLIETLILGKQAHLGSIFGAMLVISGLYLLLLGMAKEKEREVDKKGFYLPTSDGSSTTPLLGNEDQKLSGSAC